MVNNLRSFERSELERNHPLTPVIKASHFLIREFGKQVTGYCGASGYEN